MALFSFGDRLFAFDDSRYTARMAFGRRLEPGPQVRAATLTHYLAVCGKAGLDPQPLLRAAGISKSWLSQPDRQLPAESVVQLLEASATKSGCEVFGLMMAESRQLSNFGVVGLLISHQRTLRDVLNTIVQYRHLLNAALSLTVQGSGRTTTLREEVVTRSPVPARQATELAVGVLFQACGGLLAARWQPSAVHFTHAAPADLAVHRRIFQCKLVFDSDFNGIACPTELLDLPNPLADPAMADYAERFLGALPGAAAGAVGHEVRRSIYLLLPLCRATLVQVAAGLGMNERSLQRRLDEEGEHFSEMVNDVRRELALRYLANPRYAMGRVASQLGYAKQGSFTRWFVAQFGVTPGRWREQHEHDRASSVAG
ncbi:MAG TPA: AraC family transcriptional regulator [Ramlibacter sp.]|nr:AraC family transcriptional regulator [Ramlibacter sp.]